MSHAESFYYRRGKRLLDIVFSLAGLLCLSPLLVLLGLSVKFSSPGNIFFSQERIGFRGKTFRIWKFRTMVAGAERMGPGITSKGDPRITRVGGFLRRWKLDEFPQLWNVLKGEMSLVGPRPELPLYVQNYTAAERRALSVRPGITDPASLAYRNEEEILGKANDRERFYKETVLPHKLALNIEYIENVSLRRDILLILRTLKLISDPRPPAYAVAEIPGEANSVSDSTKADV